MRRVPNTNLLFWAKFRKPAYEFYSKAWFTKNNIHHIIYCNCNSTYSGLSALEFRGDIHITCKHWTSIITTIIYRLYFVLYRREAHRKIQGTTWILWILSQHVTLFLVLFRIAAAASLLYSIPVCKQANYFVFLIIVPAKCTNY